jgi:hypothetical protein
LPGEPWPSTTRHTSTGTNTGFYWRKLLGGVTYPPGLVMCCGRPQPIQSHKYKNSFPTEWEGNQPYRISSNSPPPPRSGRPPGATGKSPDTLNPMTTKISTRNPFSSNWGHHHRTPPPSLVSSAPAGIAGYTRIAPGSLASSAPTRGLQLICIHPGPSGSPAPNQDSLFHPLRPKLTGFSAPAPDSPALSPLPRAYRST